MGTSPVIPVNPNKSEVLHLRIYMFASLLVPNNPGRLGSPIYIVTMEISRHSQARHTHLHNYCGNLERERESNTFVVVPVVSVETQIMCVY